MILNRMKMIENDEFYQIFSVKKNETSNITYKQNWMKYALSIDHDWILKYEWMHHIYLWMNKKKRTLRTVTNQVSPVILLIHIQSYTILWTMVAHILYISLTKSKRILELFDRGIKMHHSISHAINSAHIKNSFWFFFFIFFGLILNYSLLFFIISCQWIIRITIVRIHVECVNKMCIFER